jgi:hypothetical protein
MIRILAMVCPVGAAQRCKDRATGPSRALRLDGLPTVGESRSRASAFQEQPGQRDPEGQLPRVPYVFSEGSINFTA